jgi:Na+/proline symporter/signal transduction histidine kinase
MLKVTPMHVWIILLSGLLYLGLLFFIAKLFDKPAEEQRRPQPLRYAFSQAVLCSSWTFLGAVGLAVTGKMEFLGIYFGPVFLYTIGRPLLRRIIEAARIEGITSLSDFLAARYGKSVAVGCMVTFVAFIGTLPFIVMQLKAISSTISLIDIAHERHDGLQNLFVLDIPMLLIIAFAFFVIIYGTRHHDVTESRQGLISVVAWDGIVKLVAISVLGIFALYSLFDGPLDFVRAVVSSDKVLSFSQNFNWLHFFAIGLMSLLTIILLPRQFHVAVVENHSKSEFDVASMVFPLYLITLNFFIFIISIAGVLVLPVDTDPNFYLLSIPQIKGALWLEVLVFIGCLSAVAATVMVAVVALTLMIANSVVLPLLLRNNNLMQWVGHNDIPKFMNNLRRVIIVGIFLCVYVLYRLLGDYTTLTSSGLISFIAMSQLAPAMFIGLFWRRANGKATIAGISAGMFVWIICLLVPILVGFDIWQALGLENLRFAQDIYTNGAAWSLLVNLTVFIGVCLFSKPTAIELQQAENFVFNGKTAMPIAEGSNFTLKIQDLCNTIELYLGPEKCKQSFLAFTEKSGKEISMEDYVDAKVLRYAEHVLANSVGAASARLIMALLIKRGSSQENSETYELLGEASKALKENRDILRRALDQVDQAITVFDIKNQLINWNKQFRAMLNLPNKYGQVSCQLEDIVDGIIKHNNVSNDLTVQTILNHLNTVGKPWVLEIIDQDVSIEILTNTMPDGGLVISWNDISDKVRSARSLYNTNESLERRVEKRTEELTKANEQLAIATKTAQEANLSKTRFLAAAGHDILQPLNAARLYASTLLERASKTGDAKLEQNILDSLSSVEDILDAVISISKLDSGSMQPTLNYFSVEKLFNQLQVEFTPIAESKNVELRFVSSTLWVRSDQNFLRRILQNLISNGIKYAPYGKVLVGCRRRKNMVVFEILDNGIGISEEEQEKVFSEFIRLDSGAKVAPGLGLGLSIVHRVAQVLNHPLKLISTYGEGSKFSLVVPIAASLSRRMDGQAIRRPKRRVDIADMKILCIDNEQKILDGMEALLSEWDCDVMTALSEEAALEIVKQRDDQIDFIVADYHLDEGKTGIDAVVAIRKYYKSPIPAVLATADRSEEVQENAARTELSILRKPIKPAALRALLASRRKRRAPQDISL